MEGLESKKLALLRILEILKKRSDYDHPLTQNDIATYLEKDYGIVIERKSIGRNIELLIQAGYDIQTKERKGVYLASREFEDSELHMLIDGVLSSKYITTKHSKDLIEKLCALSNKYFRSHVKNIHYIGDVSKTGNHSLFYNIEVIDDAIEKGKKVSFDYNKYGIDKKLHKTKTHTVSPYLLVLSNQRYYLMALNDKWNNISYYRADHITNMKITEDSLVPLTSVSGYENGIDYAELSTGRPYMFSDKLEMIVFTAEEWVIDQVVEWFGDNARIVKTGDKFTVTVKASPNAMEYWAMQYLSGVEITSPAHLRDRIKEALSKGMEKYK